MQNYIERLREIRTDYLESVRQTRGAQFAEEEARHRQWLADALGVSPDEVPGCYSCYIENMGRRCWQIRLGPQLLLIELNYGDYVKATLEREAGGYTGEAWVSSAEAPRWALGYLLTTLGVDLEEEGGSQ